MKPKFPHIWNGAVAKRSDGKLTFTYIDSYGDVITDTKKMLRQSEIVQMTKARHERFVHAGPGSRESEISRAERTYISAHPEINLKDAWSVMDEDTQMEFSMMLSMDSHHGISDKKWADKHVTEREEIIGDNQVPL